MWKGTPPSLPLPYIQDTATWEEDVHSQHPQAMLQLLSTWAQFQGLSKFTKCGKSHHTICTSMQSRSTPILNQMIATTLTQWCWHQQNLNRLLSVLCLLLFIHSASAENTKLPPTLQMTSQVYVESHDGRWLMAHALLDSDISHHSVTGSIIVFEEALSTHYYIRRPGHSHRHQPTCHFLCCGLNQYLSEQHSSVSIVPKVSTNLPLQLINQAKSWDFIKGLTLGGSKVRYSREDWYDSWVQCTQQATHL